MVGRLLSLSLSPILLIPLIPLTIPLPLPHQLPHQRLHLLQLTILIVDPTIAPPSMLTISIRVTRATRTTNLNSLLTSSSQSCLIAVSTNGTSSATCGMSTWSSSRAPSLASGSSCSIGHAGAVGPVGVPSASASSDRLKRSPRNLVKMSHKSNTCEQ